jgi:hypothetical protein
MRPELGTAHPQHVSSFPNKHYACTDPFYSVLIAVIQHRIVSAQFSFSWFLALEGVTVSSSVWWSSNILLETVCCGDVSSQCDSTVVNWKHISVTVKLFVHFIQIQLPSIIKVRKICQACELFNWLWTSWHSL